MSENASASGHFAYWGKLAHWKLDEAVILMLGKNPKRWRKREAHDQLVRQYDLVYELALRAAQEDELPVTVWSTGQSRVQPAAFLKWAKGVGVKIPFELEKEVQARQTFLVDTQAKDKQIAKLTRERDALRERVSKLERTASDTPLHETERASLLKLILGMAVDAYHYNPTATRNDATGDKRGSISAALALHGLPVDPDTVRKYLNQAEDQFRDRLNIPRKP